MRRTPDVLGRASVRVAAVGLGDAEDARFGIPIARTLGNTLAPTGVALLAATVIAMPARTAAWRAGICPLPACST